jgi:hypothetical protein
MWKKLATSSPSPPIMNQSRLLRSDTPAAPRVYPTNYGRKNRLRENESRSKISSSKAVGGKRLSGPGNLRISQKLSVTIKTSRPGYPVLPCPDLHPQHRLPADRTRIEDRTQDCRTHRRGGRPLKIIGDPIQRVISKYGPPDWCESGKVECWLPSARLGPLADRCGHGPVSQTLEPHNHSRNYLGCKQAQGAIRASAGVPPTLMMRIWRIFAVSTTKMLCFCGAIA